MPGASNSARGRAWREMCESLELWDPRSQNGAKNQWRVRKLQVSAHLDPAMRTDWKETLILDHTPVCSQCGRNANLVGRSDVSKWHSRQKSSQDATYCGMSSARFGLPIEKPDS